VGILRDPSAWSRRSQATLSIGQEIAVTLLQLASGYAALLTDGNLRAPRFLHHWVAEDGVERAVPTQVLREQVVPRSIIPTLRSLCKAVVHEEYGTGREARVEGLVMGGKTGTAQVSEEGHVGYVPDAYTANFVGVVPADNPRLLCAIVVHRPAVEKRWGGTTAASCFSRVISTVMSGTELLDGIELPPAQPTPASSEAFVQAPDLRGLRADHVLETVQSAGWQLANQPPDATAWAVGQTPPPGATIQASLPIRVAWSKGGRR